MAKQTAPSVLADEAVVCRINNFVRFRIIRIERFHSGVLFLCISVQIDQVLFKCSFQAHDVDNGRAMLFQIVVVALSPDADAGNKFIFHIANTSFAITLYRKRGILKNVRFCKNNKKPGSIGINRKSRAFVLRSRYLFGYLSTDLS